MARINQAVPKWNEEKQIWELQKQINGKRKYFSSSNKKGGYQECIRQFNSWLGNGAKLKDPRVKNVTDDYLSSVIAQYGESSESLRAAELFVRTRLLPNFKNVKVSNLNEQQFQELLNNAKNLTTGEDLSKKTVQNIRNDINLFCKFLYKSNLIDWTPQFLEIPKHLEKQGKSYWQEKEVAYFLNDEINSPHLLACQLMLIYGFRPGEVYGLYENDIKNNVITINRSLNDRNQITKGKNKNARRKELLTDVAESIIRKALEYKRLNDFISPFIFVNKNGNHISGSQTQKALIKYCKNNNLTLISPYGLRHTLATLTKHELSERQIKQIFGHSEKMNTDIYIHSLNDEELETGKALNNYWNNLLKNDN